MLINLFIWWIEVCLQSIIQRTYGGTAYGDKQVEYVFLGIVCESEKKQLECDIAHINEALCLRIHVTSSNLVNLEVLAQV